MSAPCCFQLARNEKELADQIELNHTVQIRVDHYESLLVEAEEKYEKLNDEKQVLIDHVADLQKQACDLDKYISAVALSRHLIFFIFCLSQINDKEAEILTLHSHIHEMETKMKEMDHLKGLESALHSQKWDEFSQLADSMSALSRTLSMRQMSSPIYKPASSAKLPPETSEPFEV